MARVLKGAEVDFAILGPEEAATATPRAGRQTNTWPR